MLQCRWRRGKAAEEITLSTLSDDQQSLTGIAPSYIYQSTVSYLVRRECFVLQVFRFVLKLKRMVRAYEYYFSIPLLCFLNPVSMFFFRSPDPERIESPTRAMCGSWPPTKASGTSGISRHVSSIHKVRTLFN